MVVCEFRQILRTLNKGVLVSQISELLGCRIQGARRSQMDDVIQNSSRDRRHEGKRQLESSIDAAFGLNGDGITSAVST